MEGKGTSGHGRARWRGRCCQLAPSCRPPQADRLQSRRRRRQGEARRKRDALSDGAADQGLSRRGTRAVASLRCSPWRSAADCARVNCWDSNGRTSISSRGPSRSSHARTVGNQFIVKEPKSKRSRRTIKLPSFALDALQEHRQAMLSEGNIGAPVFCTKTGQYIGRSNLTRQVFKPILESANDDCAKRRKSRGPNHPSCRTFASTTSGTRTRRRCWRGAIPSRPCPIASAMPQLKSP